MVVQNILFKEQFDEDINLYYRNYKSPEKNNIFFRDFYHIGLSNTSIKTDTYMNLFHIKTWFKYTGLSTWMFKCSVLGTGTIFLISYCSNKQDVIYEKKIQNNDCFFELETIIEYSGSDYIYLKIDAEEKFEVKNACYTNIENNYNINTNKSVKNDVHLSINICTYKRNKEVMDLVNTLYHSSFFDPSSNYYNKMTIHIVDNGAELSNDTLPTHNNIFLHYNKNTGGSGGFKRGMEEIRRLEFCVHTTHVVLMDDDVELIPESLYRLFALLSFMKVEYKENAIAGRMFRIDDRKTQYTAVEIWNKGNLQHIGYMQDMTKTENLNQVNNNCGGEYGGWWLCCYPIKYVEFNDPLPFFIHCDDVEYGLRHNNTPIILNGIQVWHETYEHRQTPIIAYYDTRNSLYVNEIYGTLDEPEELLKKWKKTISKLHLKKDFITEYMVILGFYDYCKGLQWLNKIDPYKKHLHLTKTKQNKMKNSILWRLAEWKFKHKNRLIRGSKNVSRQ